MADEGGNPFAGLGREARARMIFQLLDAELDSARRAAMRAKVNGIGFPSYVAAGKHIVRAHKAVAEAVTGSIALEANPAATFQEHLAGERALHEAVGQLQAARAFEQKVDGMTFGGPSPATTTATTTPTRRPEPDARPRPTSGTAVRRRPAGDAKPGAPGLFDKP
jgi:hypothetical protein